MSDDNEIRIGPNRTIRTLPLSCYWDLIDWREYQKIQFERKIKRRNANPWPEEIDKLIGSDSMLLAVITRCPHCSYEYNAYDLAFPNCPSCKKRVFA